MNDSPILIKPFWLYFSLLLSGTAYYFLAYQTERENFLQVMALFTGLFILYFFCCKFFSGTYFKQLLLAGLLLRILLLFSVPNLSDDVYRFIWDGRLAANGINPFSHLPAQIMQMAPVTGITKHLFKQLNSASYYSIYPPVLQGIFWLTAKLFPVNTYAAIIFMKCIIVITEAANFFLIIKLLKKIGLPQYLSLLYILNPLVITELTGNVHFEGVMIFFVLLSFLFILKNNVKISAVSFGLSIATKLIPFIFFPLLINKLGWKKGLIFTFIAGIIILVLFSLIFDITTIRHMLSSVDLFFRKFEFNASLYYVVRYIGTLIKGYNIISIAGPALMLLCIIVIVITSFKRKIISLQFFFNMALFIISAWFLFSTTVHPWYICLPVAISIFTQYRYALIWSYVTTFSYYAYHTNPVKENLWLVGAGYVLVISYSLYELKNNKQHLNVSF